MRPVRMMSLSKIRPYENNVKRHDETQIRNVMQSLTDFGWRQHIVVDSAGVIIIGHCRYEAARRLGMTEAPVEIADDLSEEQAAKLRIIDNKTNESPWDMRALAEKCPDVAKFLEGKTVVKVIAVPKRMVNFVVK